MNLENFVNIINTEIGQINNEIARSHKLNDFTVHNVKQVVLPEVHIQLKIPNKLYNARRFYKIRPSWVENKISMARNPSYYQYCINHIEIEDGLWAEFGVKFGKSAKILTKIKKDKFPHLKKPYFGFDSFEGFPEDTEWGTKGTLTTNGAIPDVDGAYFYKGWFKDTIPEFNSAHSGPLALLHVDCDIYSSTVEVLEGMKEKIVSGTVILFDDMLSYSQGSNLWVGEEHEYKAFMEFVEKYNVDYQWIASVPNASQVACKIINIDI